MSLLLVLQRLLLLIWIMNMSMMVEFGMALTIPILQQPQPQQRHSILRRRRLPNTQQQPQRHHRFDILQRQQLHERLMMIKNEIDNDDNEKLMMDTPIESSSSTTTTTTSTTTTTIQYIGTMDDRIQQITFIIAFIALGFGTQLCIHLWYTIGMTLLGIDYFYTIQTQIFPIVFGTIFALVGICHFIFVQNFARIVPPYNCWGQLWKVPAPYHTQMNISYEEYHSYWTGMVEFLGGIWLLYTGIMSDVLSSSSLSTSSSAATILPATLLFLLTIGVTPANLYMFTHNASPGGIVPSLQYPYGHIARFILQCGLLSNFYIMMHPIHV